MNPQPKKTVKKAKIKTSNSYSDIAGKKKEFDKNNLDNSMLSKRSDKSATKKRVLRPSASNVDLAYNSIELKRDKFKRTKSNVSADESVVDKRKEIAKKYLKKTKKPLLIETKEKAVPKPKMEPTLSEKLGLTNGSFNSQYGFKSSNASQKNNVENYFANKTSLFDNDISKIEDAGQVVTEGKKEEATREKFYNNRYCQFYDLEVTVSNLKILGSETKEIEINERDDKYSFVVNNTAQSVEEVRVDKGKFMIGEKPIEAKESLFFYEGVVCCSYSELKNKIESGEIRTEDGDLVSKQGNRVFSCELKNLPAKEKRDIVKNAHKIKPSLAGKQPRMEKRAVLHSESSELSIPGRIREKYVLSREYFELKRKSVMVESTSLMGISKVQFKLLGDKKMVFGLRTVSESSFAFRGNSSERMQTEDLVEKRIKAETEQRVVEEVNRAEKSRIQSEIKKMTVQSSFLSIPRKECKLVLESLSSLNIRSKPSKLNLAKTTSIGGSSNNLGLSEREFGIEQEVIQAELSEEELVKALDQPSKQVKTDKLVVHKGILFKVEDNGRFVEVSDLVSLEKKAETLLSKQSEPPLTKLQSSAANSFSIRPVKKRMLIQRSRQFCIEREKPLLKLGLDRVYLSIYPSPQRKTPSEVSHTSFQIEKKTRNYNFGTPEKNPAIKESVPRVVSYIGDTTPRGYNSPLRESKENVIRQSKRRLTAQSQVSMHTEQSVEHSQLNDSFGIPKRKEVDHKNFIDYGEYDFLRKKYTGSTTQRKPKVLKRKLPKPFKAERSFSRRSNDSGKSRRAVSPHIVKGIVYPTNEINYSNAYAIRNNLK